MARRAFSSGLQAGARSQAVVNSLITPTPPVLSQAGPAASTPTSPPGMVAASLPDLTDDGPPPTPIIGVHAPAGASASYSVTFQIGTGGFSTATLFPFPMNMASEDQTFDIYANDLGKSQSIVQSGTYRSLFL